MQPEVPSISGNQISRLRSALLNMPLQMLYSLADKYDVEIPFESSDIYSIVDSFLDELDVEAKIDILQKYADAGKVSTFLFITKEPNPPIDEIYPKAKYLIEKKPESHLLESYPYFDEMEVDSITNTLRIRFHYLLGSFAYFDESTGKPNVFRNFWRGVVIYRPGSKILEIRAKHRSIARKLSARMPAYLGLAPFFAIDLMDEKTNKRFIDWINSLNSATIQLPISEVSGSLMITARKGIDLRTARRYHEELRYGRLRHGHVTIKREDDTKINFHIHFRNCHIIYTLLTSEADIEYVIKAVEQISEGIEFGKSGKLLAEYFGKNS